MATSQLPSAVDPAVRMALTPVRGGQKKYLHGYSVQNSYHMTQVVYRFKNGLSIPF